MRRTAGRYRRVTSRLTLVASLGNLAGALIIAIYLNIIQGGGIELEYLPQVAAISIGVTVVLVLLGNSLAWRKARPLDNWYRRLAAEDAATPPPPPQVRTDALNRPVITAVVSGGMWLTAGLLHGTISALRLDPFSFDWTAFATIFTGITVISGSVTTAIVYFATERLWRRELVLFFPTGDLSGTPSFRITVRRRLMFLFIVSIFPLLALAFLSYEWSIRIAQSPQPAILLAGLLRLEIFIVGIGVLLIIALASTVGASLVEPLEVLTREMAAVRHGDLERRVLVVSNDEMGLLAEGFNAMLSGLRREEVVRDLFQRYVTRQVADYAIQHGADLGGQLVTATALFSDIRGFTSLTERVGPETLIALLNRYFEAVTAAVLEHGGLVNKFGGDSLLAIFGTPLNPMEDHPRRAILAAREMLKAVDEFNRQQEERGEPTLRIGIGIATGPVVAGNVGSTERLEYTVIGDAVNLASRLESMTKELGVPILVNEAAAQDAEDRIPMGEINVRGKREPVRVYALVS